MAETLAWVIAKEMMSKLLSLASDEEEELMSLLSSWGFKEELKCLQETAEMVQALLFDATTNNKTEFESVEIWVKKLNDVAYDADAVLEELNYETLRWKLEINRKMDKVRCLFSPSKNPFLFCLKMGRRITNINESLDEIYKEGTQIGLIRLQGVKDAIVEHSDIRLTHPYIDDSEVWGREAEVSMIVDKLCFSENENHSSVLVIVGMGGLGKTTLARLICKHGKVVRHFDEIIWITVSEYFDVTRLLNEMVQSLTGKNPRLSNVDEIVKNELGGRLKGKRYLLVLDNVWSLNLNNWYCFRKALLGIDGSRESKIMVTTRFRDLALMMQASHMHGLEELSTEKSWVMFKQRAFADGGAMETQNMVDIGRDIVERCGGLPLAIKALGGLMYSKKSETEWRLIQNSELWYLENMGSIPTALQICYEHLPSPLKHCFAFCSIFPKELTLKRVI